MKQVTMEQKSLVSKLVEVLKEIGPMEAKGRNQHFNYDYVTESQVMAELRGRLSKRNIFLFTSIESSTPHYGEPKAGVFVAVSTKHTFFDADSKEQFVVMGAGVGWDSGDKGVYKAITGAIKYVLMKNFLITDENDPEASEKQPAAAPQPGTAGHRRTRAYEEETGDNDMKTAGDLLELKAFLTEQKIPDGFLLRLLQDKELIDGHTKTVAGLKPGVMRRCLSPKSKENLIAKWKEHQAEGTTGKKEAAKAADLPDEPIRTNEGDQTRKGTHRAQITKYNIGEVLGEFEDWRQVPIHFGKQDGETLGSISAKSLKWWMTEWFPKQYKSKWAPEDLLLDAALVMASRELGGGE